MTLDKDKHTLAGCSVQRYCLITKALSVNEKYADNLDSVQQRLQQLGAVITRQTFSFPGGSRFHFTDPDGYELAVWSVASLT
ncbi:hypothetical protein CF150_17113 [Pseudomonas sp. CF150]|nr:hypothetical protein CF150_17113 [Pseudomonas sp. CF150]